MTSPADTLATIGNTVYFSYDSAALDGNSKGTLFRQAAFLNANPALTVTIEGHCDERGTEDYNVSLGERRALAVLDELLRLGISQERLRTTSYGEKVPILDGLTEAAFTQNRRGEFVLLRPAN